MIRITHILNGVQFLPWIKRMFLNPDIENRYILIDFQDKFTDHVPSSIDEMVRNDRNGRDRLLEIINSSEIVIHYFLDQVKAELILRSDPTVKHFWYFFGADIYQQFPQFRSIIYGNQTKKWMRLHPMESQRLFLRKIKYNLLLKKAPHRILEDSFNRIEGVLWYVEDEIAQISEKISLPEFRYFKFFQPSDILVGNQQVDLDCRRVLIGNSATPENNHLDVLNVLVPLIRSGDKCTFTLPLSYGGESGYRKTVKKSYQEALGKTVDFLENVVPLDQYYAILGQHPTAIMMHYRQQALGNIFYLIYQGTKLYLSEKNVIYHWLRKNHILVFSFEADFEMHFKKDELVLSMEQVDQNRTSIINLLEQPSDFISNLIISKT